MGAPNTAHLITAAAVGQIIEFFERRVTIRRRRDSASAIDGALMGAPQQSPNAPGRWRKLARIDAKPGRHLFANARRWSPQLAQQLRTDALVEPPDPQQHVLGASATMVETARLRARQLESSL
jgi:hypothetical protein